MTTSEPRRELKFAVERGLEFLARKMLVSHSSSFRQAYPDRLVNSLYFDTPDLASYRQNKNGEESRAKTRVRWYGPFETFKDPVLERKHKEGVAGWKETVPLNSLSLPELLNSNSLRRFLTQAHFGADVRHMLLGVKPVCFTSYKREYYLSANGVYRMTFDKELTYYLPSSVPRKLFRDEVELVIELKCGLDAARMSSVVGEIPFRVSRFSKYVNCLSYAHTQWGAVIED